MAEQISVERLEADYMPRGFATELGQITPFYGRDHSYVVVPEGGWLTPAAARHAAAALLTVAEILESTATTQKRNEDER